MEYYIVYKSFFKIHLHKAPKKAPNNSTHHAPAGPNVALYQLILGCDWLQQSHSNRGNESRPEKSGRPLS
jgi:hypothetical protein